MKHPIFTVLIENWKPMKESVQHPTTQASRLFRITWMAHLIFSALTHLIPLSLATPSLPAMPRTLREMWPHAISWSPFEVRYHSILDMWKQGSAGATELASMNI